MLSSLKIKNKDNFDLFSRSWYIEAKGKDNVSISLPYVDSVTGGLATSVMMPLRINSQFVGVLASDIYLDTLQKTVTTLSNEVTEYFLIGTDGRVIAHPNKEIVGSDKSEVLAITKSLAEATANANNHVSDLVPFELAGNRFMAICRQGELSKWLLCTASRSSEYEDVLNDLLMTQLIFSLIFLALLVTVLLVVIRYFLRPISTIEHALSNFFGFVNHERDTVEPILLDSDDELGKMAKMINSNIERTKNSFDEERQFVEDVNRFVQKIGSGDFETQITAHAQNPTLSKLKNNLLELQSLLCKGIGSHADEILNLLKQYQSQDFSASLAHERCGEIALGINALGAEIGDMLRHSVESGLFLEEKAQELKVSMARLAVGAREQEKSVDESVESISGISNAMNNVNEQFKAIIEQTNNIKNIVGIVREIAEQTNLLALNAAIEAARAGEAGRGFAVVADEVRALSERTQVSLSEIEKNVGSLVRAIDEAGDAIDDQTNGVAHITENVSNLDKITKQTAVVAQETERVAEEVSKMAAGIVAEARSKRF